MFSVLFAVVFALSFAVSFTLAYLFVSWLRRDGVSASHINTMSKVRIHD